MAGLEIQIGANTSDLEKKIKEAEFDLKELSKLKLENIKLGLDTKGLDANIKDVKKSLSELKTVSKDSGNAIAGMAPKVANGGNALMQFSRIAQDAPFGIMGIGNNITATAESFSYLSASAGGTGNALKAVASSLMGTGGILLAVSLVTSALTYMSQNGITVGDVFNKLTGTFDESRKAMQEMSVEVAKNSQAQISSLNALVSTAKNVKISDEDRLIAVKKLQSEYPAYFGNLTKEQILNGNVANAVRGVTSALIAKAKAAAAVDKIVKLAEEEETIQNNIKNELAAVARGYQLNKKEAFEFATAVLSGADAFKLLDPYKKRAGFFDVSNAVALNNTLSKLDTQLSSNRAKQDKLTKSINESTSAYIKLEAPPIKDPKKTKEVKEIEIRAKIIPFTEKLPSIDELIDLNSLEVFNGKIGQFGEKLKSLPGIISTSFKGATLAVSEETIKMQETLANFNEQAGTIIENNLGSTFANLGQVIGNSLANGGNVLQVAGASLLASLGSILVDLGKLAITTGIGILGIKTALKTLNPVAAIGAGVALVALGSVFSSKASSLGNSMGSSGGGSSSSGSTSTGANYSSPASSGNFSSSSGGGGTVVFEISGQSLIGVLSNTLDRNSRLGGSLGIG